MSGASPPRLARWLLERSLPADVRADVGADVEEVYARVRASSGEAAARRWYRREAASFCARFLRERLRRGVGVGGGVARRAAGGRRVLARRVSWLDFRLGARMLVRYPGLTLVGGLAMAFAIWVGAGTFEVVTQVLHPRLPLPEGHRIVGLVQHDGATDRPERRVHDDVLSWRAGLATVEDVGAFRTVSRNLVTGDGAGAPVVAAELSASAFRVTRVAPLLGRVLLESDEAAGAAPVIVLGHDVWRARFGADAGIIGRIIRLGGVEATVVGVMPEGFAFPVTHGAWVPLRLDPAGHGARSGPPLQVFGRLAPGATLAQARAELAVLGARAAADWPDTHAQLRPQVVPYARAILPLPAGAHLLLGSTNVFLLMLLVLVCGNVALLIFARAATRESEIVVRSALGASRGRIVGQLFAEALVLGTLAAGLGLAATGAGLRWGMRVAEAEAGVQLPFWFVPALSPATLLYAALLTLAGAAIAGVVPALKSTRGLQARLRQDVAQGGGARFGGIWTAVIVSQVAVTVAFPVTAFMIHRDARELRAMDVGFAEQSYLAARVERDAAEGTTADEGATERAAGFAGAWQELERRLLEEPAVEAMTYADRLPRMYHPHRLVELDDGPAAPLHPSWPAYRVSSARVDPAFFNVLGVPIVAGRGFAAADTVQDSRVVLVNESFVRSVLDGRNPVGRRVRYTYFEEWAEPRAAEAEPMPWYEIAGVVPDLGMSWSTHDPKSAGIYHAAAPAGAQPLHAAIRLRGDPAAFAPRLRELAVAADPALRIGDPVPLAELNRGELTFYGFWFRLTLAVSGIALLLSLSGIHAVMAFTVTRRTREIGIRVALGARAARLLPAVLRRPLLQVGAGLVAGAALAGLLLAAAESDGVSARGAALLTAYALLMLLVTMTACVVPVRRVLRVEPTEALRADT